MKKCRFGLTVCCNTFISKLVLPSVIETPHALTVTSLYYKSFKHRYLIVPIAKWISCPARKPRVDGSITSWGHIFSVLNFSLVFLTARWCPSKWNQAWPFICSFFVCATGVACRQGMLTPPDSWYRPIWDLHMFFLLRPILFPMLPLLFRTMLFEHLSVLPRFCL